MNVLVPANLNGVGPFSIRGIDWSALQTCGYPVKKLVAMDAASVVGYRSKQHNHAQFVPVSPPSNDEPRCLAETFGL